MGIVSEVADAGGAIIKGVASIVKGIAGRKMQKAGEKQMNKAIGDIKYSRPGEYSDIMSILNQRESTLGTRKGMVEEDIRRSTTSGISGIRQLADSPVAALGAYGGMKEKEQSAIADLGVTFEQMRDEAMLGKVEGKKMGAEYSEKEQYYNSIYKNMLYANLGANKMEAGRNMAWEGAEGFLSAGMDFLGTKYLSNKMNPTDATTNPTPEDGGSLANI